MNLATQEFSIVVPPLHPGSKATVEIYMPKDAEVIGILPDPYNSFSGTILAAASLEAPLERRFFTLCGRGVVEIKCDEGHVPLRRRFIGSLSNGSAHVFEGHL